jgi:hypothetical protein
MNYAPGQLTDEQVKTRYFVVPDPIVGMVFGDDFLRFVHEARRALEAHGRALHVVAWPDGATMLYEIVVGDEAIDPESLLAAYRKGARAQANLMRRSA